LKPTLKAQAAPSLTPGRSKPSPDNGIETKPPVLPRLQCRTPQ